MKGISVHSKLEHAQQVWNRITPEYKKFAVGDYHVYLAADVLLLAGVLETFEILA